MGSESRCVASVALRRSHACAAGDYDAGIDYLVTMGGIARENDYEYLGQDDFCAADFMAGSNKHSSSLTRVQVGGLLAGALLALVTISAALFTASIKGARRACERPARPCMPSVFCSRSKYSAAGAVLVAKGRAAMHRDRAGATLDRGMPNPQNPSRQSGVA